MEFAARVRSIEISEIRKLFEAADKNSINLGLGQPDYDTPEYIKRAAIQAIYDGKTGYTTNAGIDELRIAIAEKLKRENGLDYTKEQIIVTAGASEALHIVMQALVEPGERVLVPDPGFVSYAALATVAEGNPEGVSLDTHFHIDIEAAKNAMGGARLFVLNSPSNPTGAVEDRKAIKALVECADDNGVTVVSDEVYEHFIYEKKHVSPALFSDNVVTINATSKTYAMTGWRIGYVAAPKEIIEQCLKVHQYCQACATSISQYAALAAYTGTQETIYAMRKEYQFRRDLLYGGLKDLGFTFSKPEGAFYMFVPMENVICNRILQKGVIIVPGNTFGRNAPDYARMSYAASRENLRIALERIEEALGE